MSSPDTHESRLRFASALSTHDAAEQAVIELVEQLAPRFEDHGEHTPADLVMVFATPGHREALGHLCGSVGEALRARHTIGATVSGVVGIGREIEEGPAVSVLAAALPGVTLTAFDTEQIDWKLARHAPESLRKMIGVEPEELRVVVMLADPFSIPTVRLLPTFNAGLPGVPVLGGLLSGADKPGRNRLFHNDRIYTQGAVGLAMSGAVTVHTTLSQGCRAIGRPLVITKAKRHVVQELGGAPALKRLRETVDEIDAADREIASRGGLMVGRVIDEYKARFGRDDFLIRAVVGVDPDAGYLAIGDPQVRVGQTVQFHVRDQRAAVDDLALLLEAQKIHGDAAGAMLFTCTGRGTRLFDQPDADAEAIRRALGDVPLSGCFAAGEFGPIGGRNFVHGHAASLVVFRGESSQ